jgi:soluble lytic murein transglycosylase-like protein
MEWIKAVIGVESSYNPRAYRAEPRINDASYGLMQLLYRTAVGLGYAGEPEGLFDPGINIDLGSKFLGQLRARHGDNFAAVYSAYNSGSATKYQTSTQVAEHVKNALAWLARFQPAATGAAILLAGAAIWYLSRRP